MKSHRSRCLAGLAFVLLAGTLALGCAAHFETVDGEEASYIDTAPTNIEVYPRYPFQDGYAYEVNGRWYHRHGNRWVVYRERPRGLVHAEAPRAEHVGARVEFH